MKSIINTNVNQENGFTLMEIIVAVTILGLGYVVILQSFSMSMSNITRIDRSRKNTFASLLAFEEEIRPELEAQLLLNLTKGDTEDKTDYPSFLEGRKYRLALISSEDGQFVTLRLEKL